MSLLHHMLSAFYVDISPVDPPFRDLKSRDDFPDAFIFAAVEDVAASHENLHVICADKRLRSACDELANVSTYPDLPAFLALKEWLISTPSMESFSRSQMMNDFLPPRCFKLVVLSAPW